MVLQGKRILSVSLLVCLLLTTLLATISPQPAFAGVIGNDGAIPSGGTSGSGGGMCSATIYRISITNESLKAENALEDIDSFSDVEAKLLKHYKTHMPDVNNSIMFVPDACYTTNAALGWYEASSGELVVQRRNLTSGTSAQKATRIALHDAKVRELKPTGTMPSHVFYSKLLQKAPMSKPGDISALADLEWKKIVNDVDSTGTKSQGVWNYIFGNKPEIKARLKDYNGDSLNESAKTPEETHRALLMYLDSLMTLYAMSPQGNQKQFYESAIERFITNDNLVQKPIILAIDTAVRFSSPAQLGSTYLYIPSTSYVNWMHGATPKTSITSPDFTTTAFQYDTKALIKLSAERAMAEMPTRKRNTDKPSDTDGFTWGYSGVVGSRLKTDSQSRTASWHTSSVTGIMESVNFHGNMFGFMIQGFNFNIDRIDPLVCNCNQKVAITNKKEVEGRLASNKVGKYVDLSIDMKESDPEKLADWKELLDGSTDLQINVKLWRSQAPGNPEWVKRTGPDFATDATSYITISKNELLKYLGGQKLSYSDNLMNYTIPNDETYEFRYNASISVKGIDKDGEAYKIECKQGPSQSVLITGPPTETPGEIGTYTSYPEYWSEIKQGTPGNETFEAMAGTPTTRSLYFATGGSEFIVDVEVEYVPDMTSTRTYRSYYSSVPSEFKIGDQAKNYTVPSPSGASSSSLTINAHEGGTVTATWTGTTPYIGSVTWGDHWVNIDNRWNDTPYNTAKAQAQAWAAAVNGFTINHTAASDSQTRYFNSWGASITSDSNTHPAGTANPGKPEIMGSCGYPPSPCVTQAYQASSGQNGRDGQYSITVTGRIPARIIDGPSSIYDLPAIQDTWTQTINYDYTKINKAKVWKIDRSKVDGMATLTGTDEITASITQGDPTVFYNIAEEGRLPTKASEEGRLRYSLEPDQHDAVVWYEGPRTNKDDGYGNNGWISGPGQSASWATGIKYTNNTYSTTPGYHETNSTAKDKLTTEYKKFAERRTTKMEVTAISDFLILQTSSGDQSVMYFDRTSPKVESQRQADVPKTSFADQWTDNSLSAAKWKEDHISIGSYNGNYAAPLAKYSTTGSTRVATKFDTVPAGLNRTPRPAAPLRLAKTDIDVIDTISNGQYVTGNSSVFYQTIVDVGGSTVFPTIHNSRYGAKGAEFATTYSPAHSKVNDIVIHNPVSVEEAIVIPLPQSRDQRTNDSKLLGGNLQPPSIEYERRLKPGYVFTPTPPTYTDQTVANPDYVPAKPAVAQDYNYSGAVQTFQAPRDGTYTIEAWGAEGGHTGTAIEYEWYNPAHDVYIWYPSNTGYADVYCGSHHPSHPTGATRGGAAGGGKGGYSKGAVHLHKDEVVNVHVGGKGADGTSNYGVAAGGWNGGGAGNYLSGGGGGASDVRQGGTALSNRIIVAGGGGGAQHVLNTNYLATGGAGGGETGEAGHSHGYWTTQYSSQGGTQSAGGAVVGQLQYQWYNPDHNVYLWYDSPTGYANVYCGAHHPSHYTGVTSVIGSPQGNPGTAGHGGSYSTSYHGGGGGGYYGGASGAYHGYSGAGGSGYIGGVSGGTMVSGVRSGDGLVRITSPAAPAIGSPTKVIQVMTDPGMSEPPDEAYEYIEIVNDPAAPVSSPLGTFAPGNFINLDYPFRISFPNRGNFYGNGSSGLYSTSPITGKGYVDGMDTTEWTASKQVKFNFFVTYNGTTYTPGEWIDLAVNQTVFDFYLPLGNSEAVSALVEFRALAINADYPDHDNVRNKERFDNLAARHSAIKSWNIDIVGRIGGLVIEDTEDFRFSNLFKQPRTPTEWYVPKVVLKVNSNSQNRIVGDSIDVRGETLTASGNYMDTYGLLPHLRQTPIPLPLSPDKNNIAALQKQPMRLGYDVLADIQTIGNYYDTMQIIPYYYSLNLSNGAISPVDIYMNVNGVLKPINKFGAAVPGWDPNSVHSFVFSLDWISEAGRRNYTEATLTDNVNADNTFVDDLGVTTSIGKPYGNKYTFGTAQIMNLTERNRTFIGTDRTNGVGRNPGGVIPSLQFGKQGQRWHFTYGLPSSAVAVGQGQAPTQENINAIRNQSTVLIAALDIKVVGNTFALQYSRNNGVVNIADTSWSLASIPYPVVAVYSSSKSSSDDLSISGTH